MRNVPFTPVSEILLSRLSEAEVLVLVLFVLDGAEASILDSKLVKLYFC